MKETIRVELDKVIEMKIKKLSGLKEGSEEHQKLTEDIQKLCTIRQNDEKIALETGREADEDNVARMKVDVEKTKLFLERRRYELERDRNNIEAEKINLEDRKLDFEKTRLAQEKQIADDGSKWEKVAFWGGLATTAACTIIQLGAGNYELNKVLNFETTGSIVTTAGKGLIPRFSNIFFKNR